LAGNRDQAVLHFQWVTENGAKSYTEYDMARCQLKRLQQEMKKTVNAE
jgi:cell division protein FtsB